MAVDRARISPGGAHRADPAELLDIEMDELTGMLALVSGAPARPVPGLSAATGRRVPAPGSPSPWTRRVAMAMCLPVRRCRRSAAIASATAASVRLGLVFGREERSAMPALPSARKRSTQRATTFAVTPYVSAAWALERRPSTTSRAISSRRSGVRRAFLWMFIRSSGNH